MTNSAQNTRKYQNVYIPVKKAEEQIETESMLTLLAKTTQDVLNIYIKLKKEYPISNTDMMKIETEEDYNSLKLILKEDKKNSESIRKELLDKIKQFDINLKTYVTGPALFYQVFEQLVKNTKVDKFIAMDTVIKTLSKKVQTFDDKLRAFIESFNGLYLLGDEDVEYKETIEKTLKTLFELIMEKMSKCTFVDSNNNVSGGGRKKKVSLKGSKRTYNVYYDARGKSYIKSNGKQVLLSSIKGQYNLA